MNSQFKEVSFVWGMGIGNLRWLLQVELWTRVVHLTQLLSWCSGSIFPVSSSPNLSLPWRPLLSPFLPTFNRDQQHCNLPSPILPHFSSVRSPLPASFYCLPFKELRDCLFFTPESTASRSLFVTNTQFTLVERVTHGSVSSQPAGLKPGQARKKLWACSALLCTLCVSYNARWIKTVYSEMHFQLQAPWSRCTPSCCKLSVEVMLEISSFS